MPIIVSPVDRAPASSVTRLCGFCGDPFVPVRPHQRFCRLSCRINGLRTRERRCDLWADDDAPEPAGESARRLTPADDR
jgi:hypothetical protein